MKSKKDSTETVTEEESMEQYIRNRIVHFLGVYPILSPSMLQIGIGNAISSRFWRPVLDELVKENIVLREEEIVQNPSSNRQNTHIKLSLHQN